MFLPIGGFSFLSQIPANSSLTGATVTASVYSGVDPNPSAILSGAATFLGALVNQLFTGGVVGVIYEIKVQATDVTGQTLIQTAYLAITPDLT